METVTWMSSSAGLNNVVDPTRIEYDPKKGVGELGISLNIDTDRSGRISRRLGYRSVRADVSHSLWTDGQRAFFVANSSLFEFYADGSSRPIRSEIHPTALMSFVNGGGDVYYCNGVQNGVIRGDNSYAWIGNPFKGPEDYPYLVTEFPPVGHLLDIHNAYMLVAQDNIIWASMPFAFSWYRRSKDFWQFESRLSMMRSLGTGIWASCSQGVFWLEGKDVSWSRTKKSDSPAIRGTDCVLETKVVGLQNIGTMAVIWTSPEGIYLGDDRGNIVNMTTDRLEYPSTTAGAGVVIKDRYITSLRP